MGLIGAGTIGQTHMIGFETLRRTGLLNIKIAAVCDTDEKALNNAVDLFDIPNSYTDYKDLIANDNVDIVYICTPTSEHFDMVKAAARATKPVFCEKPLAHSCPQARDLVAVIKDKGVPAGVGLVLRYDQFLLHAKKLINDHDFGKPMLAHIRDDQRFPVDYRYYSKWRGNRAIAGGGTLIEHSIHDIDILNWFLGDIESVYAKVGFHAGREVEDVASLIMTHKNGVVSTLDSIWHWVDRPNERFIEFFFEKGYIGIRLESGKRYLEYQLEDQAPIRVHSEAANLALIEALGLHGRNLSPDAYEALTAIGTERYSALSYSFIKAVQSSENPSPSFLDAVAAHKIVDAAYESSNKNRSVAPL